MTQGLRKARETWLKSLLCGKLLELIAFDIRVSPWWDTTASITNRADASVGCTHVTTASRTKEPPPALLCPGRACAMLCSLLGKLG